VTWENRGVVFAARDDGPRNCTEHDKGLRCIKGGLEPMSARIYGDTLVLITDGRAFEVFVAPVAGLQASSSAELRFERAADAFLSTESYAKLPTDYEPTALRVLPRTGTPRFCGVSETTGGLTFVMYPLVGAPTPTLTAMPFEAIVVRPGCAQEVLMLAVLFFVMAVVSSGVTLWRILILRPSCARDLR
jgi:hypothetical protein